MKKHFHKLVLIAVLFGFLAPACAAFRPTARTVNDAARFACETMLGAEAQQQGISVQDLCAVQEVLDPFIRQILAAQASARAGLAKK